MRLRDKILLITIPFTILPMLLIAMLARFYLLEEAERLEDQESRRGAVQARNAILNEIETVYNSAMDWGYSDDTYSFLLGENPDFVRLNLTWQTFESLQLNLMVFSDTQGKIILAKGYDLVERQERTIPDGLRAYLESPASPLRREDFSQKRSGLIIQNEEAMAAAVIPILTSGMEGPPDGYLLFGRRLDPARLQILSDQIALPIELLLSSQPGFSSALEGSSEPLVEGVGAVPLDHQTISGFALLNDLDGEPAAIVQVSEQREIFQSGVRSLEMFGLVLVLTGIVFIGLAVWLIDHNFTRRIIALNKWTTGIGSAASQQPPEISKGHDEIADLTGSIESMLKRQERAEEALRVSETRYRAIVERQTELVCRWKPDGSVTFANTAFCSYVGEAFESLIGKDIFKILGETAQSREQMTAFMRVEKGTWSGESRLGAADGQERWQEWNDQPEYDSQGELMEVLSVGRDVTRRVLLERALQKRLVFQRIVTQISSDFVSLIPKDVDSVVNSTLKVIGEFMSVDRSYVFFIDSEKQTIHNAYEWCAPGIKPQIQELQKVQMRELPTFFDLMNRREVFNVPNVAEMPAEMAREKAIFKALDLLSVLAVPMEAGGELIGFLGLDAVRSAANWSGEDIQLISVAANIIAVGLARSRYESRLLTQQKRLELSNEITQAALYAPALDWLLNRSADLLKEAVEADAAVIAIGDAPGSPAQAVGVKGEQAEELRRRASAAGVFLDTNPMIAMLAGLANMPATADGLNEFQTEFVFPLVAANLELGTARLLFKRQQLFSEAERELCEQGAAQIALAVLKVRALDDAHARLAETETLRQAGSLIAGTLKPDEAVDRILDQLQRVVPYDSASVQLLHDGELEIVGGRGWGEKNNVIGLRFSVPGDNPNSVVVAERGAYVVHDTCERFPTFSQPPHDHIRSWLGVPLIVRGELIGMLTLDHRTPNFYRQEHAQVVSAFADQVAISYENARLFSSEHQRALELDALRATSNDITAELDLTNLLQAVVDRAVTLLNGTGGELGLFDQELRMLHVVVSNGLGAKFAGEWIEMGEGAMGRVAQTLEPMIVQDYLKWDGHAPQYVEADIHAALAAPLLIRGRLLGVIGVGTARPDQKFSGTDLRLLNLFAQQAAIAVENARLFETLQTLAITDEMTGLYNRRGLMELGQREVLRAGRSGKPLAVMMFDIDHFKLVNDRFSHATGDLVLQMIAEQGRKSLRQTDVLGRYGGEEIAVVLPETEEQEAFEIAEQFRNMVATYRMTTELGEVSVTMSCGISWAIGEVPDLAVMLDQADTALYAAKLGGRNQTQLYSAVCKK